MTATYSRVEGEAVGDYAISATLEPEGVLGNYNVTHNIGTLSISKRAITVTADNKTKAYGDSDPVLTYEVTSGSLVPGDAFTGALTREGGEEVGEYDILQGTLALNGNYDLTFVGALLTITPATGAPLDISNYSDVYDGMSHSITVNNLITGDTAYYRLNAEDEWSTTLPTFTDVTDEVTVYVKVTNPNYAERTGSGTVTITARPVTVKADAKTKTYGDVDPVLTYEVTSGSLVSGDAFTGELDRVDGENVGTYAINQGTLALNGNYDLTYRSDNLVIEKRNASVTPDDKSKTYGNPDPELTGTLAGFLDDDGVTATYSRVEGEAVGDYAISATLEPEGVLGNYNITYNTGTLCIEKRAITVTAHDQTKVFEQGGS